MKSVSFGGLDGMWIEDLTETAVAVARRRLSIGRTVLVHQSIALCNVRPSGSAY